MSLLINRCLIGVKLSNAHPLPSTLPLDWQIVHLSPKETGIGLITTSTNLSELLGLTNQVMRGLTQLGLQLEPQYYSC